MKLNDLLRFWMATRAAAVIRNRVLRANEAKRRANPDPDCVFKGRGRVRCGRCIDCREFAS